MIKVSELSKSFEGFCALDQLNLNVNTGSIYGLIGTNGSGKTTLIKHLTGVFCPDSGQITVDGMNVYDNLSLKQRTGYIPDDLSFYASSNLMDCARFFRSLYPRWNQERFLEMSALFKLDPKRRIGRFSKGMQKQAAFLLNLCACPDYLILDEPIDGLDPIVRKLVWNYVVADVAERNMTVLVSSHNLREMEGICDSIGILNQGKMVLERDLDDLRSDIHKIQVVFREPCMEDPYKDLSVLHRESHGSVDLLIVRDKREVVEEKIRSHSPVLFDILPLSLEEIFIYELGGENSEIQDILL